MLFFSLRPTVALLDADQLETLCPSSCLSDLTSLLSTIEDACTASIDVMVPDGVTAYPGTSSLGAKSNLMDRVLTISRQQLF